MDDGVWSCRQGPRKPVPHTDGWTYGDFMAQSKEHRASDFKAFVLVLLLSFCGDLGQIISLCASISSMWPFSQLDLKTCLS